MGRFYHFILCGYAIIGIGCMPQSPTPTTSHNPESSHKSASTPKQNNSKTPTQKQALTKTNTDSIKTSSTKSQTPSVSKLISPNISTFQKPTPTQKAQNVSQNQTKSAPINTPSIPAESAPPSDSPTLNLVGEVRKEIVEEDDLTFQAHTSYKQGTNIKHGKETLYYLEGGTARIAFYNEGKLVGLYQMFSPEGVLIYEAYYQNGLLHGLCKIFDVQSGIIKSEMDFAYGQQEGIMRIYQNGIIWYELHYHQGKKNGTAKTFNNQGKVIVEDLYNNDELISSR